MKDRFACVSASDTAILVKQAVDIVDVIGQVVPLRRSGKRYTGLCPFHSEKPPPFRSTRKTSSTTVLAVEAAVMS